MDDNMKERVMESLPILKELPLEVREEVKNKQTNKERKKLMKEMK